MFRRPLLRQASAASFLMRSNGRPPVVLSTIGGHRAFHATTVRLCPGAGLGSVPPCSAAVGSTTADTSKARAETTSPFAKEAADVKAAPSVKHPGMEDQDAWRGPLTGKPLSAVFTKNTQTWSDSVCIGGPAAGGADGAPAVVDAATKQRIPDLAALLERRTAAGFGRSDAPKATFHDDGVRRTSVATGVEVEWPGLAAAVEKVRAALYPGEGPLTATLHNVLVYEAGDHFDWHRDMPKVPGHLATLSVECDVAGLQSPGPDAAAVVFAEEGAGADDFRVYAPRGPGEWAAWPIATRHRAVAVPAGANRVTAIFNLARAVGDAETPLVAAVAAVPATHRPAMAAVGEWMAQQRPVLWTHDRQAANTNEFYDASGSDADVEPLQHPEHGTRTAIGILLEDVIGVTEKEASLSEAEEAQAKEEEWSKTKKAVFLSQKKVKTITESLKGKWRDLTQRDRLLYFAAVARFGEENVFLHQAKECDAGWFSIASAAKHCSRANADDVRVKTRPFDHVFIIGNAAVEEKLSLPEAYGTLGNSGPEVALVYDRTVLCVTLRRSEE